MSDHYADHYPRPEGPSRSWGCVAEGPGRWCILEAPMGHPAVLMFVTDRGDAVGVIQNGQPNGAVVAEDFAMGVQGAKATGQSSPTVVFEAWAGRNTQALMAGTVEHAEDLGAVAAQFTARTERGR